MSNLKYITTVCRDMQFKANSGKFWSSDTSGRWNLADTPNKQQIADVLQIPGTIGATPCCAYVCDDGRVLFEKKRTLTSFTDLYFVCLQRYNKKIKTCDIVWLNAGIPTVQTIDRAQVDEIRLRLTCDVYVWPMDPLPWSRFLKDATTYSWEKEDWVHLMAEESSEESEDNDSDWVPSEEDSDE